MMNLLSISGTTTGIIIAAVAVVVILIVVLIIIMSKRGNTTSAERTREDRELIEANSKSVEALVVLAKGNEDLIAQLREVQEKLKYLRPSDNAKVLDSDKAIKNKISDLRIALTKSDGEASKKAEELLTDIKLAIADRNAKI